MDIEFEVVPSHVEELIDGYDFIPDLCEANARAKAEPIAELHPECLVIAADTLVYLEDELFGKPTHVDDALERSIRQRLIAKSCILKALV